MKENFYEDEKELLNAFLDARVFNESRTFASLIKNDDLSFLLDDGPPTKANPLLAIELIVKPQCNQQCEYCYMYKYGTELYPIEERVDDDTIINNLDNFLDYLINTRHIFINHWELFAGDMFANGLIWRIFDIFKKYYYPIYDIYPDFFKSTPVQLLMPCNCTFVQNENERNKWIEYRNEMIKHGIGISISYSGDGKFATKSREKKELSDEYYNTLFSFLSEQRYFCHPMVAAMEIDSWIENYDWWYQMYQKWYPNFQDPIPMLLEVRNDDWTPHALLGFQKLLAHMINHRFELCNNDLDNFTYHSFVGDGRENSLPSLIQNDLIKLKKLTFSETEAISCSLQGLLHVTLNNLSIVPCHRTSYPQFTAGYFKQDETGKIIDIIPKNVDLLLSEYMMKMNKHPECYACKYQACCQKGCLGAQFEKTGELFLPLPSVCEMEKLKNSYLAFRYWEMGIIDNAYQKHLINQDTYNYFMLIKEDYPIMIENIMERIRIEDVRK